MEEIWKDIPGYEGIYQASTEGRIRSLKRNKELMLKISPVENAYPIVSLHSNNIKKTFRLHKLIAITFLNHISAKHELVIDHINGIREDNRLKNLRIVSQRENTLFGYDKKNTSSKFRGVGWHKNSKKWISKIYIDKKIKNLGYFDTELEAHEAYQRELSKIIS